MLVFIKALLLILVAALAVAVSVSATKSSSSSLVAFFCADNGDFSGMGELHYISMAVVNPVAVSIPQCGNVTSGSIVSTSSGSNIPVLVVTTGISALNAAMCTSAVLAAYPALDQIIYIGTSGFSQFEGGLDPTQKCNKGLPQSSASIAKGPNSIGSVCVTYAAASYACGLCVHNNSLAHSSECSRPSCNSRDAENLFGPCTFFSPDPTLQMDIMNAIQDIKLPEMPSALKALSAQYWAAQTVSPGIPFPAVPSVRTNCIEMDMQTILASGPADYLCREYTADVLNSIRNNVPPNLVASPNDVTCVNAMEGVGFLRALYGKNPRSNPTNVNIRSAIIRGAANWDTYPLVKTTWDASDLPADLPPFKWIQNVSYVSAATHGQLTQLGYQYSIWTTNTIGLAYINSL